MSRHIQGEIRLAVNTPKTEASAKGRAARRLLARVSVHMNGLVRRGITLDLYAQAGMPNKGLIQSKLVRMALNKVELTGPCPKLPIPCKCLKGMAGTTGLEPATSAVTGQRSNQLNYVPG